MNLKSLFREFRGKRDSNEYVDSAEVPEEPAGPYRANLSVAAQKPAVQGIDVTERAVVPGDLWVIFVTRCPCGYTWETQQFQQLSICPQCDRAVIVDLSEPPSEDQPPRLTTL